MEWPVREGDGPGGIELELCQMSRERKSEDDWSWT